MPTETPDPGVLVTGGRRREPAAYLGLGLVALVAGIMTVVLWGFAGQGPWPVPIVWGVATLIALRLLATREVRIAPDGILLTRHLFRWHWTRRLSTQSVTAVRVQGDHVPLKNQRGDGTPEGEARMMLFTVALRGGPRLTLGFSRDAAAMERLAGQAARLLGVPAVRCGYRLRGDGLPLREKGAESPIA
ncbi:hypothetical protein [Falsiroseomonas sp. HW251]|uniref:hypothetical protein n=1 Tax=Falsiroseomonas sp. HW251 TaxID=3390998 RepID=UPI003D320B90